MTLTFDPETLVHGHCKLWVKYEPDWANGRENTSVQVMSD